MIMRNTILPPLGGIGGLTKNKKNYGGRGGVSWSVTRHPHNIK